MDRIRRVAVQRRGGRRARDDGWMLSGFIGGGLSRWCFNALWKRIGDKWRCSEVQYRAKKTYRYINISSLNVTFLKKMFEFSYFIPETYKTLDCCEQHERGSAKNHGHLCEVKRYFFHHTKQTNVLLARL